MNTAQRKVLLRMGGWMLADLLIDYDSGWTRIMQSMCGGCGPRGKDDRDDDVQSYSVRGGKITGELFNGAQVVVTRKAVAAWLKSSVTAEQRAELVAVRAEMHAEQRRTEGWCWCGEYRHSGVTNGHSYPFPKKSYHPTEAETDEHYRISRELREREKVASVAALHLLPEPQPGEQMELFA